MFNRPRCRDYVPLSTQQLRLRNLIQITGHKIICDPKCSIYYTLHMTSMSAPFFTSEKIETPNNAIWSEINCQNILQSSSTSVCIRIWQHQSNVLTDKVLFLWGVYFSGLVPIKKRTEIKFNENSLVFQMHGGYFTAVETLLKESLIKNVPKKNDENNLLVIPKNQLVQIKNNSFNNLNCDGNLSKNNSFSSLFGSSSPKNVTPKNSPDRTNLSNSPFNLKAKLITKDLQLVQNKPHFTDGLDENELIKLIKVRYIFKDFLRTEIRPSYEIKKLLLLREKQRTIKYRSESAKEVMDKICMKSAFCLNLDLIANRPIIYQTKRVSGMGKTLNRLLFQPPEQQNPEDILKAQELRRQIEIAKFRCRLLHQERDKTHSYIRKLEIKHAKISDSNIDKESWLMAHYRNLSREKDAALQEKISFTGQKELYGISKKLLQQRRNRLLKELNEIYCIEETPGGFCTINKVPLPDAENYSENTTPLMLSVSLGYAAHAVLMCSVLLNTPLRNNIKHEGSRSKILDNIKMLPESSREFPLFCRETPPPNTLLYGVFLLNQNIAQLKYMLGLSKGDLRATLPNLLQLLNGPRKEVFDSRFSNDNLNPPLSLSGSSIDLNASPDVFKSKFLHDQQNQPVSLSLSSIDLNVIPPINKTKSKTRGEKKDKGHRVCRSDGSFTEEELISNCAGNRNQFSSEPILLTAGQKQFTNFTDEENI